MTACRTERGFTLIEILAVLLIITVLTGLTVARLPGFARNADFDTETRRLELLFNLARQEAVLDSAEFGFQTTRTGYKFRKFNDAAQQWRDAERPFHARTLPEDMNLRLRADSDSLRLAGDSIPPVLLLSSGETTPFRLVIESRVSDATATFNADEYGDFSWSDQ